MVAHRIEFVDDPPLALGQLHGDGFFGTLFGTLGSTPPLSGDKDMITEQTSFLWEVVKIAANHTFRFTYFKIFTTAYDRLKI